MRGEFADLGYARSAWAICGSLGVGRFAGRSSGWRGENELGFTLRFTGGKPFSGSATVWPDGFAQHFVTEISNGRLARWQAMLREQFSDGTERSPSLPQLDDDIPGRQQVLELLLVTRRKFRHRFADIVWIKCGHARITSGEELSAVRKRCNCDPDMWRIQRGRGLDADTDCSRTRAGSGYSRPGHGLAADADAGMAKIWSRTGRGRGLDTASAGRPVYGADIPRPTRDHFEDAESFAGEGVRLVLS